jgi:hypothetical protein
VPSRATQPQPRRVAQLPAQRCVPEGLPLDVRLSVLGRASVPE